MRKQTSLTSSKFLRTIVNRKRLAFLALLLITVTATAVAIVSTAHKTGTLSANAVSGLSVDAQVATARQFKQQYVQRARLQPLLRAALETIGDRLEKPGKEAVVITGQLTRNTAKGQVTGPVRIILQQPNHIRIEEPGSNNHITTFDGQSARASAGLADRFDQDLIESLVYDSADRFFLGQMQELSAKLLGSGYRLDDGADPNYSGGYYHLYQIRDHISIAEGRDQFKQYFINRDSLLLELVRYDLVRDSRTVGVEIHLNNWQEKDGQRFPASIVRFENKQQVMALTINSINVGAKLDNGLFAQAQ
ncbi:MAG TPA: hypothetical protein VFC63_12690 [Blastocatellia bacterium]|nr:hypothetical protein [Blastocatellia bacterium]